jgi:hypothetical protein
MSEAQLEFTANYTRWPFNDDRTDEEGVDLRQLPSDLRSQLVAWADRFLLGFDEERGRFRDEQERQGFDAEYQRLAARLKSQGIIFRTSRWWS